MNADSYQRLEQLVEKTRADGVIDEAEVSAIKQSLLQDHKVTHEEASLLFDLKDFAENMEYGPEFRDLFVNALTSYLLFTGSSPGTLDTVELVWLQERIKNDAQFSDLEKALLYNLKLKATELPVNFHSWTGRLD